MMRREWLRNELQEGYRRFFLAFPYEIMVTAHFGKLSIRHETANKHLKSFLTKIAKTKKTQIACIGVLNTFKSPHAHLLIFGKTKSLKNLSNEEIAVIWRYGSVLVSQNTDSGAAFYVALNITPHLQDKYEPFFYNFRLLKKWRVKD